MIANAFANALVVLYGTDLMEEVLETYIEHIQSLNQIGSLLFILFKDDSAILDDNGDMTVLEHYSLVFQAINEWLLTHPEHRSLFLENSNV